MEALFLANIEEDNKDGGWLIRLTDTTEDIEKICKSLEEFKTNIDEMGLAYGGDVEVSWSKDKDVTDTHFKEIHDGMAYYKEESVDKSDDGTEVYEDNSGFNPNG